MVPGASRNELRMPSPVEDSQILTMREASRRPRAEVPSSVACLKTLSGSMPISMDAKKRFSFDEK